MLGGFGETQHRLHAAIQIGEHPAPVVVVLAADHLGDLRFHFRHHGRVQGHALTGQFRLADGLAELGEKLRLQAGHGHKASVAGAVAVIEAAAVELGGLQVRILPAHQRRRRGQAVQAEGGVGHGDVHVLALAGALAVDHRRQHAHHRMAGTAGDVRHLERHRRRAGGLAAVVGGHAGDRQIVQIVAGPVPVGPVLAVAGNRAVDQPRVDRLKVFVAHAQAVHDPGAELLDDNVVLGHQPPDDLLAFRLLQIHGDRPLGAVDIAVHRRHAVLGRRQQPHHVRTGG